MGSKCHKSFSSAKIHKFSKNIYIIHYIYVYKSFSTTLDKGLRKNKNNKKRDGEIGKHTLNEMEALNMKQKKWNKLDKSKRSSYNPVVFKHAFSLEAQLELWRKKAIPGHFYFSKTSKITLICIWILKRNFKFLC